MRKIMDYRGLVLVAVFAASNFVNAQTNDGDSNVPRKLTDTAISERLATDWNNRNAALKDQSIAWFDSNDGYFGTYSICSKDYMSRYDKKGTYIETLSRKEWDEMVPRNIKSSFDKSVYKSQDVTSFWEVSEPFRRGYYLELKDNQNKVSRVWADENGRFSTIPYTGQR